MNDNIELYENEDGTAYAVLVSGGYGATWSDGDPVLACDRRIVEFWLAHKDDRDFMLELDRINFCKDKNNPVFKEAFKLFDSMGLAQDVDGDVYLPYMGGFYQIHLEWMPYNTMWRIHEYDGSERVVIFDHDDYNCFSK